MVVIFFSASGRFGTPLAIEKTSKNEAVDKRTQKETKMRALQHTSTGNHESEVNVSFIKGLLSRISHLSEAIWFCLTFLLFIVMGPFSVIAVVYGLWSLGSIENREKMIEPARC